MKVSVSDVAPASGAFELIPEGSYNVRIQDAEERVSQSGNPMFQVDLEILDTDQKGRSLRAWIVYMDKTRGLVKGFLDAIDYPEVPDGGEVAASSLIGRTASVLVRHRDYIDKNNEHKQSASVMAWERASGAFHAAPGKPVSPAQVADSEIPF